MTRRELLHLLSLAPVMLGSCGVLEYEPMSTTTHSSTNSMPVIFAAHGAPILLDDATWMAQLADWAKAMAKPKAILMISAHWEARPTTIGATRSLPLVYDFYGFPDRYYQTKYPAPGAPELAARVRELLAARSIASISDAERGLDHGAYVPLVAMYGEADVPVLQISMPGMNPRELFELGRALAPLRNEGVLVFGSGFLTHNMRYAFKPGVPRWASDFDEWVASAIRRFDVDALLDFETRGPASKLALPTAEHYAPLLVALGAASEGARTAKFPIEGWWMDGAFTKRSVQFG